MFKNVISRVIFVHENSEYLADLSSVQSFGIIKEMQASNQVLRIQMPKWVSKEVFGLLKEYIQREGFSNSASLLTDQILQRMLWLGDHLQSDDLQEKTIQDLILPRVQLKNCTLFLNEAFKKLKACEESGDIWYMLLNTCMNFTAKHLILLATTQPGDLQRVNQKIIEEILDRALKYHRRKNSASSAELLKVILSIRGFTNPIELINNQKVLMKGKRINFQTHPSINWKLSNLSSIVNKETQPFKFSDYNWKLLAKMEEGMTLRIYLKLEGPVPTEDQEQPTQDQRIICLYFLLSLNNSHEQIENYDLKPSYIISEKGNTILLCEFKDRELYAYDQQKLEFTVFLNTDQVLQLAINHIFTNLELIMKQQPDLNSFDPDDAMILLRASPPLQKTQEQALAYLMYYLSKVPLSADQQQKFIAQLHPQQLSKQFLQDCRRAPEFQVLPEVQRFIMNELDGTNPAYKATDRSSAKRDRSVPDTFKPSSATTSSRDIKDDRRTPLGRGQSHERGLPKSVLQDMPLNKLEKLKKNNSQTRVLGIKDFDEAPGIRRESTYSQSSNSHNERSFLVNNIQMTMGNDRLAEKEQRKRQILEEINILRFVTTKDPMIIQELGEVMNGFL